MAMPGRLRYRADDIWDTPDDGNRYEVIDGEMFVTPPPIWVHQNASGTLYGYIWRYVHPRRLGKLVSAPVGVKLDEGNGVQPDLVYNASDRADIIVERGVEGAPTLVVEVLSPSTPSRDRGVKMRRYAAAGIPHYWILDPRPRALEAYRLGEGEYQLVGTFGPGTVFTPELFPGLEIPIDDLWA
jgi:Uma2 family endonuclease